MRLQEEPFKKYLAHMKSRHESISTLPKWWRPEILRAYLFILSYVTRSSDEVPAVMLPEYKETLRLLPILCEEFVKASAAARNRMLRVRSHSLALFSMCSSAGGLSLAGIGENPFCHSAVVKSICLAGSCNAVSWLPECDACTCAQLQIAVSKAL